MHATDTVRGPCGLDTSSLWLHCQGPLWPRYIFIIITLSGALVAYIHLHYNYTFRGPCGLDTSWPKSLFLNIWCSLIERFEKDQASNGREILFVIINFGLVNPAGLLLEFESEASMEMPLVWLIAHILLLIWGVRTKGEEKVCYQRNFGD